MSIPNRFQAFRIRNDSNGYRSSIEDVSIDDLAPGEIVIKTAYSSVNYKDALAGTGEGKILRFFPLVGGIDVAGEAERGRRKAQALVRIDVQRPGESHARIENHSWR